MARKTSECSWRSSNFIEKSIAIPELIGYYSVDKDSNYLPDSSLLLYYNRDKKNGSELSTINRNRREDWVHFDLNHGMKSLIRGPFSPERWKLLFHWIKLNRKKIEASPESGRWIHPNFVCRGELLMILLTTQYSPLQAGIIRAAKWKGTIYLSYFAKKADFRAEPDAAESWKYWSRKFRQYLLSDSPDAEPDIERAIVDSEEFRGVYKLNVGRHEVLYDAVVNGVISEKSLTDPLPLTNLKLTQFKTRRIPDNEKQERNFKRFKLLRFWAQGFLTNADTCVCGSRDDDGIVHKLTSYRLEDMVNLSKIHWKPAACIDFCEAFLNEVSKTVVNDCSETIYEFEKSPGEQGCSIVLKRPSAEHPVIPQSFLDESR